MKVLFQPSNRHRLKEAEMEDELWRLRYRLQFAEFAAAKVNDRLKLQSQKLGRVITDLRQQLRVKEAELHKQNRDKEKQLASITHNLFLLECKLRKEQLDIHQRLREKDDIISRQQQLIGNLESRLGLPLTKDPTTLPPDNGLSQTPTNHKLTQIIKELETKRQGWMIRGEGDGAEQEGSWEPDRDPPHLPPRSSDFTSPPSLPPKFPSKTPPVTSSSQKDKLLLDENNNRNGEVDTTVSSGYSLATKESADVIDPVDVLTYSQRVVIRRPSLNGLKVKRNSSVGGSRRKSLPTIHEHYPDIYEEVTLICSYI